MEEAGLRVSKHRLACMVNKLHADLTNLTSAIEDFDAVSSAVFSSEQFAQRKAAAEAQIYGTGTHLVEYAKGVYVARRARTKAIPADLLGEPGYDMLLDAFVSMHEGKRISVSSACIASGSPPTTGLRWLMALEQRGFMERFPDPADKRVKYVRLTEVGMTAVTRMLEAQQAVVPLKPGVHYSRTLPDHEVADRLTPEGTFQEPQ